MISSKTEILFANPGQTNSSKSSQAGSRSLASKTDFGDPAEDIYQAGGTASDVRGIAMGGEGSGGSKNNIQRITIQTAANASDLGDLSFERIAPAATSNGTRGVSAGGRHHSTYYKAMDYVTIDNTSNSSDFGDLAAAHTSAGIVGNSGAG